MWRRFRGIATWRASPEAFCLPGAGQEGQDHRGLQAAHSPFNAGLGPAIGLPERRLFAGDPLHGASHAPPSRRTAPDCARGFRGNLCEFPADLRHSVCVCGGPCLALAWQHSGSTPVHIPVKSDHHADHCGDVDGTWLLDAGHRRPAACDVHCRGVR